MPSIFGCEVTAAVNTTSQAKGSEEKGMKGNQHNTAGEQTSLTPT